MFIYSNESETTLSIHVANKRETAFPLSLLMGTLSIFATTQNVS